MTTYVCPVCQRTYTPTLPIKTATCNGGGRHRPRVMTEEKRT